ncbi:MAG: redoxin domain-containing protein [Alphaproteobacteria bacterium]|nr:redoxin domain-containing protein [Alphaproteobacteria bacterium]
MRTDIKVGALFPDYELPDHTNTKRKLSQLQGMDPMVIMLGRGIYCPKDRQQLRQLVDFSSQMDVGFSRIVYINCDNLILSNDLRLGMGAHWPFLRDENRTIMHDLEIQEYTDPHNNPMIPHTFVLEPGLKIYKIYNGYWYWGRPSMAELHQDLRDITMKCRYDFKIDTIEMRAQWERNERDNFYPYGKSWEEVFIRMAGDVDKF